MVLCWQPVGRKWEPKVGAEIGKDGLMGAVGILRITRPPVAEQSMVMDYSESLIPV